MSKMPAKKKSCFQITSVTQAAQMAVSCTTDDTESLDDPDESRTEDVSSEIFDVSRADFDPGVCDRSSSEEALNITGEVDAAVMALNIPQEPVSTTGPFNGGHSYRSTGQCHVNASVLPALSQPLIPNSVTQQATTTVSASPAAEVPPSVSHTPAAAPTSSATTTTSCSSRFRVIKLDHSTGEPFRRGRWMCTEFYERDSEGSGMSRTADSIKHTANPDHSVDRDSGLGTTGGSAVSPGTISAQVHESSGDSGYSTVLHGHHPEPPQQVFGQTPQAGSRTNAFQPAVYSVPHVPPGAPQTHQPAGLNGVPPGTQSYTATPPSQLDYRQQHLPPLQGSSTQPSPMAPLFGGPLTNQGTSPVITPAGGAKGPGLVVQSGAPPQQHSPVVQNLPAAAPGTTNTLPGSAGQGVPTTGQGNDGRRRSDAVPQPSATPGKDVMRPFMPESLHLATPTVNSLLGISIPMDGDEDGSSGASIVAIDNKIEQAMDLVKSHLMYAVREEVEVLKEQIKELYERNSQLERENAVLKSLANTEQLTQLSSSQVSPAGSMSPPQQPHTDTANTPLEGGLPAACLPQQPNVTSA
ncbi:hypothetical protein DPEC_G00272740 [Dallia pectoralis]|uniref:Uncharacterized protein n=1 Tax=Dallia pectoralis TaxID=75939 RepID=A0ACC2FQ82_DALPE|nr:hypothetical protein DPEC_G00272740 [Dallia pectoralis]